MRAGGRAAFSWISPAAPVLGFGIALDSLHLRQALRVTLTTEPSPPPTGTPPSPSPTILNGSEDCVEMRANAQWNDDRCNAPLIYVCECDGVSSAKTWCDTSSEISCGDCSTVCAADQTCNTQQCKAP